MKVEVDFLCMSTHVQHAQPISVAYWLSHYAAAFLRDLERLKRAYDITDQNPLGAGALAGSSFPIDRNMTTQLLGFQEVHEHGMDTTSSRDFMLEILSANAILETTASRIAEEFILWSSHEFRTLTLDDSFAMGSSMMPQKKNPGAVELLRGRAGRVNGLLSAGLTMMKGLPSGYNRDFHEEKEVVFESLRLVNLMVDMLPKLLASTTINKERMKELSYANFSSATEVANFLVRDHDIPFRKAHHIVGSLVGKLHSQGKNFSDTNECVEHMRSCGVEIPANELKNILNTDNVMRSYESQGGTGPKAVAKMLDSFESQLCSHKSQLEKDKSRVTNAYECARKIATSLEGVCDYPSYKKSVDVFLPINT